MTNRLDRRDFLTRSARLLGAGSLAGASGLALAGCGRPGPDRYNDADRRLLAEHPDLERQRSGQGPFGRHLYRGYRGLAELPWFELDAAGNLQLVDDSVPDSIDFHAHLGMSLLFEPKLDLTAPTDRVRHLLDCDGEDPGCELDLDLYINGNFTEENLEELPHTTFTQGLWGNDIVRTHTIPNLLAEMDAMRVTQSVLLPIVFDLPFGDKLEKKWLDAVAATNTGDRFVVGTSAHPEEGKPVERLEAAAARGARIVKMHPTVQGFYPDDPKAMEVYEAAERLGLTIFFHGGRAGIEPESRQHYAMPRHYEAAFSTFKNLRFIIGHGGARDGEAMLDLAVQHENAWLGVHGQGITHLDKMIRRTGGEGLLFGTDWPFYHLAATLAKVLIVTDSPERAEIRHAILRGNAEVLLG